MKIIVTGSEGFIGKELVRQLRQRGNDIVECDRKSFQEVITMTRSSLPILKGTDAIVHLAAQTSVFNDNLKQIKRDNIDAFMNVVTLSNTLGCRLVYASSSCAANITSMYGLSKRFDEEFARIYANDSVGVRFHNVYGPGQRPGTLLQIAMDCAKNKRPIVLYNHGNNRRHFTFIEDIVKGIVKLLHVDIQGVVNICNPQETSTLDFIKCLSHYVPVRYVLSDEVRAFDKEMQFVDSQLQDLDLEYTTLDAGLYKTVMRWGIDSEIIND